MFIMVAADSRVLPEYHASIALLFVLAVAIGMCGIFLYKIFKKLRELRQYRKYQERYIEIARKSTKNLQRMAALLTDRDNPFPLHHPTLYALILNEQNYIREMLYLYGYLPEGFLTPERHAELITDQEELDRILNSKLYTG